MTKLRSDACCDVVSRFGLDFNRATSRYSSPVFQSLSLSFDFNRGDKLFYLTIYLQLICYSVVIYFFCWGSQVRPSDVLYSYLQEYTNHSYHDFLIELFLTGCYKKSDSKLRMSRIIDDEMALVEDIVIFLDDWVVFVFCESSDSSFEFLSWTVLSPLSSFSGIIGSRSWDDEVPVTWKENFLSWPKIGMLK